MRYEVGDTVILLHSKEEGEIVEILSKDMVQVKVGSVDFPVFIDQIDYPYFQRFRDQSKNKKIDNKKVFLDQVPKETRERRYVKYHEDRGIQLTFFPVYHPSDHSFITAFKLYLINQNCEPYKFDYDVVSQGDIFINIKNVVKGDSDFYLNDIQQEDLNDISKLVFRFSLVEPNKEKEDVFEKVLKIKAKIFFKKVEEMELKNVPSFSYDLFTSYPDKMPEPYIPLPESLKTRIIKHSSSLEPARSVIDLHLDKILPNHHGMTNFEKMSAQLDYFEKYYRLAVAHMQPSMTVIHGVGAGKLKEEIHARLKTKKEVKSFVNQYSPLYGFGATEIYFQY